MLHAALTLLASQLNQQLLRTMQLQEEVAVVANLAEADGSVCTTVNNKLALTLTSIAKDTTPANKLPPGMTQHSAPPLHLNLFVMLSAHFSGSNYPEALKLLSAAIQFFQQKPVFTHQNTPDLDPRIDKLVLDIENLSVQDQASLWGSIGNKYQPSVLYKIRMVTFDGQAPNRSTPRITAPGGNFLG
ncbi:MAG: hypothetical protein RIR00_676 [Pseudomonadota bacterium]